MKQCHQFYLLIVFLLIAPLCISAQPGTNGRALSVLSGAFRDNANNQRALAAQHAADRNIPMRGELPNGKVFELIGMDNDIPLYYMTNNANAAISTRTNELWSGGSLGLSLSGTGFSSLGIWDGGAVRTSHQEFNNTGSSRVSQRDGATTLSAHATHVAGTMVGGGVYAPAKGMAFDASLQAYDWNSDDAEMASAAAGGMKVSNHSYGFIHGWNGDTWYGNPSISTQEDYKFGWYSSYTRNWDQIAYNAPYYLIVKAAGNDRNDAAPSGGAYPSDCPTGYDCIGTQGVAKNILTVGAAGDVLNYTGPGSVSMSSFSGWGPADDGRIKPDIVGNGVGLTSSVSGSDSQYSSYSGTSMASPNVSGTLALLQQHYQNTHAGASMRAATLKALVIHTADEAGSNPGPDYRFGWGLLNAARAAEVISLDGEGDGLIEEQVLNNGQSYSFQVESDGTTPLVVTIAWTDPAHDAIPAGLDVATPHLVNDLDLRILKGGTTYYPYSLNKSNPSAAATKSGENNIDNVEQVYIGSPAAGTYTVQIDHDGTLSGAQYFSVIVSGKVSSLNTAPVAAFTYQDTCLNVNFSDASSDAEDNLSSWLWDFGDGTTSTEQNPVHIFAEAGSYMVSLVVTDLVGATDTSTQELTLNGETVWYLDADGDNYAVSTLLSCLQPGPGYTATVLPLGDCDDSNAQVNPGAQELCDGIDNNCDGVVDEGCTTAPIAAFTYQNICLNVSFSDASLDADGDLSSWYWDFGDGTTATEQNPVHIFAEAGSYTVSLVVTDLAGTSDTSTQELTLNGETVWYLDADGDNYAVSTLLSCLQPGAGYTATVLPLGDCDDSNAQVNPGAQELCDGIDNNCDGVVDEGCTTAPIAAFTYQAACLTVSFLDASSDADGDLSSWFWDFGDGTTATVQNPGHSFPTAGSYTVSLVVTDLVGATDTSTQELTLNGETVWYLDADGDNYAVSTLLSCLQPGAGYTATVLPLGDCDDSNAQVNPGAQELCDGIDNNCDGVIDEGCTTAPIAAFTYQDTCLNVSFSDASLDADGDLSSWYWDFGDGTTATEQNPVHIFAEAGSYMVSLVVTDLVGATDTSTQELTLNGETVWYLDADGDNYAVSTLLSCLQPGAGYTATVLPLGDCDDSNAQVNPGAQELCDGIDNNCNGVVDEGCALRASVHVQSVTLSTRYSSGGRRYGVATVLVLDDLGDPVAGASVSGSFSGDFTESPTAKRTDEDGEVVFVTSTRTRSPEFSFCINDVTYDLPYEPGDNGASVTVCPPNVAPVAQFEARPSCMEVAFIDRSDDEDGRIVSWAWNFGDGGTATVEHPYHTFAAAGSYTVSLTVTDDDGATGSTTQVITLAGETVWYLDADGDNYAVSTLLSCLQPGEGYTATVLPLTDCDDDNAQINPGAQEVCDGIDNNCDGVIDEDCVPPVSVHVQSVTLSTRNSSGGRRYGVARVVVSNDQGGPVAGASVSGSFSGDFTESPTAKRTDEDGEVVFVTSTRTRSPEFSFCINDVTYDLPYEPGDNGASVTVCPPNVAPVAQFETNAFCMEVAFIDRSDDEDGRIVSWAWDFGDGGTATVEHPYHTFAAAGTYTVSLTVTDDDGATGSTTRVITLAGETVWYLDADGDNYASATTRSCTQPGAGYTNAVLPLTDCNDRDARINPGAEEVCDGIDNNCDGVIDEGCVAPVSVHVQSVTLSTRNASGGRRYGIARVVVSNDQGGTVAGASVSGSFSGDFTDSPAAKRTDENGVVVFVSSSSKRSPEFSFCINDVTYDLPYEPGDNGVSVTVCPPNVAPVGQFEVTTDCQEAIFTDASNDADGTIVSWSWDFGDGAGATRRHPEHAYAAAGTYTVSLTVTDDDGATHTSSQDITITGPIAEICDNGIDDDCDGLIDEGCSDALTVHVESVDFGKTNGSRGRKFGLATITVLDDQGEPVSDALVSGSFTGDFDYAPPAKATDAFGEVTFQTDVAQRNPRFRFCISDVEYSLPYDEEDNGSGVETCSTDYDDDDDARTLAGRSNGVATVAPGYPNPTRDFTYLRLFVPQPDNLAISIADLMGKELKKINIGTIDAGQHLFRIPANDLEDGVYLIWIKLGDQVFSQKLVVLK